MATHEPHQGDHGHGHVHMGEADWEEMAADAELQGELLLGFLTDTTTRVRALRSPDAPPVARILDVGCGPGVGSCELARSFPTAAVVALDSSPGMLERAARRASRLGLDGRVATLLAEVPGGLDGVGEFDVIWASMSLHHVGDQVGALRALGEHLGPGGLLAVAEMADPLRVLPDDVEVGRPGLIDRMEAAWRIWFASMRAGLSDSVASDDDLPTMLGAAGLEVLDSRIASKRFDPPLSEEGRQVAQHHLSRSRHQLGEHLDEDDLAALGVLADPDDPRGVMHRPDVFLAAWRQIAIARRS